MCRLMLVRIALSITLEGVQRSVIGLYEVRLVSGLLGLRIVMILPSFQSVGMIQCA